MTTTKWLGWMFLPVLLNAACSDSDSSSAALGLQGTGRENVEVIDLRVNGRYDEPLGLGDPSPILGWRMRATPASLDHACQSSGPELACPADVQTAYQIQVANDPNFANLIWDSGKVESSAQSAVPYAGSALGSRERAVWRVRVWGADGGVWGL